MKILISYIITLIIFLQGCNNKDLITENMLEESRNTSAEFMGNLKKLLINKISEGGVINAVSVCSDTALAFTKNYSDEKGLKVKRTSFKTRNQKNIPDDFESKVLKIFEKQQYEGRLSKDTEYAEIVTRDGKKVFRYMKPILISAECLTCHGSENIIPESVILILNEKYPKDNAKDFKTGDLRGAISIVKTLD